jgi:hypothetical protein
MHLARFAFAILPVAAGLVAQPVWAVQARWLTQTEILQQFNGATIDGRYASGKAFTERYAVDGRLFYREARLTLGGHWSVTGGTLCTIYDFDASGGCYRVARVDTNCFADRSGGAGTSRQQAKLDGARRFARQGQRLSRRSERLGSFFAPSDSASQSRLEGAVLREPASRRRLPALRPRVF